jgi:hypothetical protein
MKLKITFVALTVFLSTFFPFQTTAQICETDGNYEQTSQTYRTVELPQFGISVDIPSNYRAMARQNGSVEILHPDDYQMFQCLVNGGRGGRGYYSESIRLVEDDLTMNLRQQAIGYLNNNRNQIIPYQNHGISGYIVTSFPNYSVTFLGTIPNQQKLLEVNASCDCDVSIDDLRNLLNRIKLL